MKQAGFFIGVLVLVLAGCKPSPNKTTALEEDGFSFVFLTDIHVQPERGAEAGFQWAIREVNRRKPDFVITGGAVSGRWWANEPESKPEDI